MIRNICTNNFLATINKARFYSMSDRISDLIKLKHMSEIISRNSLQEETVRLRNILRLK